MGGTTFECRARGKTSVEAFQNAQEKARYDHGHAGYTGTIAEKHEIVMITKTPLDAKAASELAKKLIDDDDRRICDKWGPAGCIPLDDGQFMFFGWASC